MSRAFSSLFLTAAVVSCVHFTCCHAQAQITLFDNTGGGPVSGPKFDPGDRFLAQQFLTGDHDNVSSISVALQRVGSPSGPINLAIWDKDASGLPGELVGSLGTIDISNVTTTPSFVTFAESLSGLSPNTPYYVVLDSGDIPMDSNNTLRFGVVDSDEGTNGANKVLALQSMRFLVRTRLQAKGPTTGKCP